MRMRTTKALIADDDAAMRGLVAQALDALDIEVIEAHDPMSALALARDTTPDLIVLDVSMPGGNGLSACEMLASVPSLRHVPTIVLTGKSDDATLFRCQNIGARYILKGADALDELKSVVRRLLCIGDESCVLESERFVG